MIYNVDEIGKLHLCLESFVLHNSLLLRKAARWRRKVARATIISIILALIALAFQHILSDAINGIIGNAAFAILPSLWERVTQSIKANAWPWYITGVATVVSLGFFFQTLSVKGTLKATSQIVDLDDEMLRQLASAMAHPNPPEAMHRLLERLLRNVTKAFPEDPYKASILLPDANKEYLVIYVNYRMSADSVQRAKFYIGRDENKKLERGTAGLTYLDEQLRLGHVIRHGDDWEWEAEGYISFVEENSYPSHQSFIALPIIGVDPTSPTGKASCLGVVCFDSSQPDIFESLQKQRVLQTLVRRIAVTLIVSATFTQGGGVA